MTEKEFLKRSLEIKEAWLDNFFEENIKNIYNSGMFDIETLPPNYSGIYPAVAAILEQVAKSCIYGGSDGLKNRRLVNKIKKTVDIKR